ncbi:MAG: hypothetical protein ACR2RE_12400 [Geminicoccaceae bacterium]
MTTKLICEAVETEVVITDERVEADVVDMTAFEISKLLGAVVRGIFGGRTVVDASARPDAILHARHALSECDMEIAKGLRILAGMLSEKFAIDDESGVGTGEGE